MEAAYQGMPCLLDLTMMVLVQVPHSFRPCAFTFQDIIVLIKIFSTMQLTQNKTTIICIGYVLSRRIQAGKVMKMKNKQQESKEKNIHLVFALASPIQ